MSRNFLPRWTLTAVLCVATFGIATVVTASASFSGTTY
jgi:hypothetical protein